MHTVSRVVLLSIGTEILFGEITDTNAPFLAGELTRRGAEVIRTIAVPDDRNRLAHSIGQALLEADLVLTTGGLGPTDDDPTREAVCDVLGEQPEVDAKALEHLEAFFQSRGRPMPASNQKQAWKVPSVDVLENPIGTAPGWFARVGSKAVVSMPGPPREMKEMWAKQVLPRLTFGSPGFWEQTLHTCGIGESMAAERLGALTRSVNPYVGTYARRAGVDIRVSARAGTSTEAQRLAAPVVDQVRLLMGDNLYGCDDDTLASAVGANLRARGQTIATLESVTGGLVADLLTDVSGSSAWVVGGAVGYTIAAKVRFGVSESLIREQGVVSEPVAQAMAVAAKEWFRADWGVATTGVAGPDAHGGCPPGHTC
ncbi:MAG TPA: CinA family nicotinamide mononucleotide deamidase-related protein, partial [Candidatus Ozemobacteraceae bacterium]|nr:CinA family nicotinamide mononucleotide deamidase-related protein [Candidatus Ozemobacteraceae bacterium]